jgi:magnesium-transporting ATPase (P-type)
MNEEQCVCLDLDSDRNSILYAGTTLIHCSNTANQTEVQGVPIPEHDERFGVICMALRTGTYSSKGQLMRTLKSGSNIGAISNPQSEKDSIRLILSLSLFAMASSVSLFLPREPGTSTAVPTFRRIIQITRILIAGIPSDLPLALSAVARSCSERLRQDSDVICSEPGALLTAAYVDTVVFDKVS